MQIPPSPAHIAAQAQRQQTAPRRVQAADLADLAAKPAAAPKQPDPVAAPQPNRTEARFARPGSVLDIKV